MKHQSTMMGTGTRTRTRIPTLLLLLAWYWIVLVSFLSSTSCPTAQAFVTHPILVPVIRGGCDHPSSSSSFSSSDCNHQKPTPLHLHPSKDSSTFEEEQPSSSRIITGDSNTNNANTTFVWNQDALYLERYKRRKQIRMTQLAREQEKRPPNPNLDPRQVVTALLEGLRTPHDPLPYFGVQILWESSTSTWQETLGRSIGMNMKHVLDNTKPNTNTNTNNPNPLTFSNVEQPPKQSLIVQSLYRALARPHQQFAILFSSSSSSDNNNNNNNNNNNYWVEFPSDVLEWDDQECWIECRLRSSQDDQLLAVLGWTLQKKDNHNNNNSQTTKGGSSSCWYLQALDWQDFRDAYRPGIGREEWERICG
jgi:hypothetical protein